MSTPHLHEAFPELRTTLGHVRLGEVPTPVRELPGLRPGLWLKDDGAFGSGGWGGNKVRKLEWLLPEARRRRAKTILTFGATGTNWGLACALYAREQGLRCALALVDQPEDEHVRAQLARLRASGADLHFTRTFRRTALLSPYLLVRHLHGGRLPFVLPAGGSSPVGTLGYVEAAYELAAQVRAGELPEPERVVVALGSGGSAAGLALGLRLAGLSSRVHAVIVSDLLKLDARSNARLIGRTARLLARRNAGLDPAAAREAAAATEVDPGQLGPGYGHATAASTRALALAADAGLALEPVYTAKALAAALALPAGGPVLFMRTNGPR